MSETRSDSLDVANDGRNSLLKDLTIQIEKSSSLPRETSSSSIIVSEYPGQCRDSDSCNSKFSLIRACLQLLEIREMQQNVASASKNQLAVKSSRLSAENCQIIMSGQLKRACPQRTLRGLWRTTVAEVRHGCFRYTDELHPNEKLVLFLFD